MNNQDFNTELFDRYLHHQLSEAELIKFDENLLNDDAFNSAFIAYKTLALGIRDYGKTELKDYLKEKAKVPVMSYTSKVKKIFYAAAAVVLLFTGLTLIVNYYIQPNEAPEIAIETTEKSQKTLSDTASDEVMEDLIDNTNKPSQTLAEKQTAPPESSNDFVEQIEDKSATSLKTMAGISEDDASSFDEPYKILSDYKTSDTLLFALIPMDPSVKYLENISISKAETSKKAIPSAANNNVDKNENKVGLDSGTKLKNKAADLKTEAYTIEFWQSPVNFKGYKMIDKTIQLYGLTNKNLQLFNYSNKIYLRNGSSVLSLMPCNIGCTYKIETDAKIINIILNQ